MKSFDEEKHIYRVPSGRLPGATDIIKSEGMVNSDWFTEEACWRGKMVHEAVRRINRGTYDDEATAFMIAQGFAGYVTSYILFLKLTGFEIVGCEEPLFDDAFACMPDSWGKLNGLNSIVEYKTGAVPKWAKIQTALQARALKKDRGFIAHRRHGLQLMKDGSLAKLTPPYQDDDDYAAMSMVQSFHWKKDHGYIPDWRK